MESRGEKAKRKQFRGESVEEISFIYIVDLIFVNFIEKKNDANSWNEAKNDARCEGIH